MIDTWKEFWGKRTGIPCMGFFAVIFCSVCMMGMISAGYAAPHAADDYVTTNEDVATDVDVLSNDTPDGFTFNELKVHIEGGPYHGEAEVVSVPGGNDYIHYTPEDNYQGEDTIRYHCSNPVFNSNPAYVYITINAVNDVPIAEGDEIDVEEDGSTSGDLTTLVSDVDFTQPPAPYGPEGDNHTYSLETRASHGAAVVNEDGTYSYTPNENFNGTDAFTYKVTDKGPQTATATIVVNVTYIEDNPVAVNDGSTGDPISVTEDTPRDILVLGNDDDADIPYGDHISVDEVAEPGHGEAAIVSDEEGDYITYTPDDHYNGPDQFTYTIIDNKGNSSTATVYVNVAGESDDPVANDDGSEETPLQVTEDTPEEIDVLANDTDPDIAYGDNIHVEEVTEPSSGSVEIARDGSSVIYTPDANFNGADEFTYRLEDDAANSSEWATVYITVEGVNDIPVAVDDDAGDGEPIAVDEDGEVTINVLDNDYDYDILYGDAVSINSLQDPSNGVLANLGDGNIRYTPNENYYGTDQFTYSIIDGQGSISNFATVYLTVLPVNDPPVFTSPAHSNAIEDMNYTYTPGVTDVEGDEVTWSLGEGHPEGMNIDPNSGTITWLPTEGLDVAVDIIATDDGSPLVASTTQEFSIDITPVNDAPQIDPIADAETDEDIAATIPLSGIYGGDSELEEGIAITATSDNQDVVSDGSITVNYVSNNPTGSLVIDPVADASGVAVITVTVTDDNETPGNTGDDESITETFTLTVHPVNDAPDITSEPVTEATEDQPYQYQATAVDVEGDNMTWSLISAPEGMTIDGTTGLIQWTPLNEHVPSARVEYRVTDDGTLPASRHDEFIITIVPVNDAPVVNDIPDQTIEEGESFVTIALDNYVEDVDNNDDEIVWTATGQNQLTVTIDAARVATITIPNENWNGFETVTFSASDGEYSDNDHATFAVTAINDAPVIQTSAPTEATEDVEYTYTPNAIDVDNSSEDLTWTIQSTTAQGMTIDAASGAIAWTPLEGVASASVTIRVTDNGTNPDNQYDEESWTIAVNHVNDAPAITSDPFTEVTEEIEYSYTPKVDDPDLSDSHTWNLSGEYPEGMEIDEEDGTITWTPAEGVTTSGEITLVVTDDGENPDNLTDEQVFTITVTQVNDAPEITSTAPLFAEEDVEYTYFAQAHDPDLPGDVLTWSLENAPAGMTINAANGAISWTPTEGIESSDVTVRVTDNGTNPNNLFDEQSFSITVNPVNDAPSITSSPVVTAVEDELYLYNATATDPDAGDVLTWSLTEAPEGMNINTGTGQITWTPREGVTSAEVTVKVTDNGSPENLSNEQSYEIDVAPVNDAPQMTSTAPTGATEGVLYSYTPTAKDVDNDVEDLTWSLSNEPEGMVLEDNTVTWTPENGVTTSGDVTLTVSDPGGLTDEETFTIAVEPVNDAPHITSGAPRTATEDEEYAYNPTATDVDNTQEELTWSLHGEGVPEGMVINVNTGAITWTPGEGVTEGSYTVRVTDPDDRYDEQPVTVEVTPVNDAPVITTSPSLTATEEVEYTYDPDATDAEGNPLTWSLQRNPAGMTIDATTGAISWTPVEGVTEVDVTVRVSDNNISQEPYNAYTDQSFSIAVTQINDAPEIVSEAIITAVEDQEYTYDVEVDDVDLPGDVLTFTLESSPDGMTIDAATGLITWTPGESDPDDPTVANVQVRVTDDGTNPDNLYDDQFFQITVTPVNDAPVITSEPLLTATEETEYSYTVTVEDIEGDELTITLETAPVGMSIDGETNEITWTPADGVHRAEVVVRVTDNGEPNEYSEQSFTIDVTPVNDDPRIDTPEDMDITEDDPEQIVTLTGISDGDENIYQELTITAVSNYPDRIHNPEVFYMAGSDEAQLTFTPDPNANGVVTITLTVADEEGASIETAFDVNIDPVNDMPEMDAIEDVQLSEDDGEHTIMLTGIDDGDPEIVQSLSMTATSSNINIIHNPVVDLEAGTLTYTPVADANGTVTITVTLTDDGTMPDIYDSPNGVIDGEGGESVFTFDIEVLQVNDAPIIDQVADQEVSEGDEPQTVALTGIGDGDPDVVQSISISATSSNTGLIADPVVTYTDGAGTGSLEYTIMPDAAGTVTITVAVTDDGGTEHGGVDTKEMTFDVAIASVDNDPPAIDPIDPITAAAEEELIVTVTASDPDNEIPVLNQPTDLPEGATFVDNGDGTGTMTWMPTVEQTGDFTVTFVAEDGEGLTATAIADITIEVFTSQLTVEGLSENGKAYLYATSGWIGTKVLDGNGTITVKPGSYVLCAVDSGARSEYVPLTIEQNAEETVTLDMRSTVPTLFGELTPVNDADDNPISLGVFASAIMEDIDRDGDEDLVAVDIDGMIYVYTNNEGLELELSQDLGLESESAVQCIRLIDLDGDNALELLLGMGNGEILALDMTSFETELIYTAQDGLTGFDLADINGDDEPDIFLGYADGTIDIAESDGAGGHAAAVLIDGIDVGENAAITNMQLSADNEIDLLTGNMSGEVQWMKRNDDGTYTSQGAVNAGGKALTVTADAALSFSYNGVGELAKIVVTDESGNVSTAQGVLTGDFNDDGVVDFTDFLTFIDTWNVSEGGDGYVSRANMFLSETADQIIDFSDFLVFIEVWNLTL